MAHHYNNKIAAHHYDNNNNYNNNHNNNNSNNSNNSNKNMREVDRGNLSALLESASILKKELGISCEGFYPDSNHTPASHL